MCKCNQLHTVISPSLTFLIRFSMNYSQSHLSLIAVFPLYVWFSHFWPQFSSSFPATLSWLAVVANYSSVWFIHHAWPCQTFSSQEPPFDYLLGRGGKEWEKNLALYYYLLFSELLYARAFFGCSHSIHGYSTMMLCELWPYPWLSAPFSNPYRRPLITMRKYIYTYSFV